MAYREKQTWLIFLSMIIAYGIYFPMAAAAQRTPMENLLLFGVIASIQALVVIICLAILATQVDKGEEARKPDERDRAIARRGATAAYYLLMAGTIMVGVVMPFTDSGWTITNAALFAIVLAETVRLVVILFSYRRGWHG